jgi:hypothetical protein
MYNWLGQKIEVGTVVGRGARDGNTSTFKVGVVTGLDEKKQTARVAWKLTPRTLYRLVDNGQTYYNGDRKFDLEELISYVPSNKSWATTPEGEKGRHCSLDSLFVLDKSVLLKAERLSELVKELDERQNNGFPVSKQDWEQLVSELDWPVVV